MELTFTKAQIRPTMDGDYEVSFIVSKAQKRTVEQLWETLKDNVKEMVLSIAKPKKNRSKDANAYFHVLVHEIARVMGLGEEETKVKMVLEYGAVMKDENGDKVGIKLPVSVDVNNVYKYAKWFDKRLENGKEFNCYIVYEHTHKLDTKAMARLIDGTVYEAEQLDIETMPIDKINHLKEMWK